MNQTHAVTALPRLLSSVPSNYWQPLATTDIAISAQIQHLMHIFMSVNYKVCAAYEIVGGILS